MSSAASNYNVPKLVMGIVLAASSLFLALASARRTIIASFTSCAPLLGVSILYGVMMFASSYVEEEQHFWYWTTSAWLLILWVKR
jgi:ethanolaminephosphotransferase